MSFGPASFGEFSFGESAAAATVTLLAPAAAELAADAILQTLGPIAALELAAEFVTDGVQVSGPDALELAAEFIQVELPAPSVVELIAESIAQPLPAPVAAELAADAIAAVLFDTFVPLILSAEKIYGVGAATWTTLNLTAVVGTKNGAFQDGSIVGVS